MSKIFECGEFVIQVWPLDHLPVHCHVCIGESSEIKIFLPELSVQYVKGKPLSSRVIKEIIEIVKSHKYEIGKEWRRFHGN